MPSSELSVVFYYVYVLHSNSSSGFYVGFTVDLRKRLIEHNSGLNFSTKPYAPWQLIYYEAHTTKADALRREKYLKTSAGSQALSKMLRGKIAEMKNLKTQKVYY